MKVDHTILYRGKPLVTSDRELGFLRTSSDIVDDVEALRQRLADDGYLFLPGYLDRARVLEARRAELRKFAARGFLNPDAPLLDGVVHDAYLGQAANPYGEEELNNSARSNPALLQVLYDGPMIELYERLFGEAVRHYDYTWQRAKTDSDESASPPHCDIVFMGRGSHRLCTSWTPLGDIPMRMGGLMVLEGSCHLSHVKATYGQLDVDRYCTNHDDASAIETGEKIWQGWTNDGAYNRDAAETRGELGGRWLTTDYRAGDLLVFGMFTMHASMDNLTNRFRLSTDTRYQPASEPIDERWIGENPIKHGPAGKKAMIC